MKGYKLEFVSDGCGKQYKNPCVHRMNLEASHSHDLLQELLLIE